MLDPRPEQFEHAPGAGAEIEQRAHRDIGERGADRFLHRLVGDMKLANAVPLRGMAAEIGLRRLRALRPHGDKTLAVAPERGVVGIEAGHELARERRRPAPLGQTEEGPRPFAETLDQASFRQQSQMARDAGLRLAQDGGEIGHGELRLPQ